MDSYTGQIRIFGGKYAPQGWAFCNGAILPIQGHEVLFALIGTTYGGNGSTNFALPNLQLSLPVGRSGTPPPGMTFAYPLGSTGGSFIATLTMAQIPAHSHPMQAATGPGLSDTPSSGALLSGVPAGFTNFANPVGSSTLTLASLNPAAISSAGYGGWHFNGMPSMAVNFIICVNGIFPQWSS